MSASGEVRDPLGAPCRRCRVVAVERTSRQTFVAVTDTLGRFRVDGLPSGEYRILSLNPDGYIAIGSGNSHVPGAQSPVLKIRDGINVSGIGLHSEFTPSDAVGSLLRRRDKVHTLAQSVTCTPGDPQPRNFNGVTVLDYLSESDEFAEGPLCDGLGAERGCHQWTLDRGLIHGRTRCIMGRITPESYLQLSLITTYPPASTNYSPPQPTPAECELIRRFISCDALIDFFHPYAATVLHECVHRQMAQEVVTAAFDRFLDELRSIQNKLDSCQKCNCASPELIDAILEAEDRLIYDLMEARGSSSEGPPTERQCQFIRSLCN